jgi:hypothetical protein
MEFHPSKAEIAALSNDIHYESEMINRTPKSIQSAWRLFSGVSRESVSPLNQHRTIEKRFVHRLVTVELSSADFSLSSTIPENLLAERYIPNLFKVQSDSVEVRNKV